MSFSREISLLFRTIYHTENLKEIVAFSYFLCIKKSHKSAVYGMYYIRHNLYVVFKDFKMICYYFEWLFSLHVCCKWSGCNLDRDIYGISWGKMLFDESDQIYFKGNINTQLLMEIHQSFDIQICKFSQKTTNMYVQITIYNHCKGGDVVLNSLFFMQIMQKKVMSQLFEKSM